MRIDPDNPPKFYFIQLQQAGTDLSQETSYLDFQTGSTVTLDSANNRARVNTSYTTLGFTTPVGNLGKILRSDNTNWTATSFTVPASFAAGDLLHASASNVVTALADVATGNALISGGVNLAPAWGKIGLTTHVSEILPLANGGTNNLLTASNGGILWSDASKLNILSGTATAGQILRSGASATPAWSTLTIPDALPVNQLFYASSANVVAASGVNLTWNASTRVLDIGGSGQTGKINAQYAIGGYAFIFKDTTTASRFGFLTGSNGGITWGGFNGIDTGSIWMGADNSAAGAAPALTILGSQAGTSNNVGIRVNVPTAKFHIAAGTATANTAPQKFSLPGVLLTTPEAGAFETTADNLHFTITTGAARKGIMLDDGARLTSGKIPVATTNGRLQDGPAYDGTTLTVTQIAATTFSAGFTMADAQNIVLNTTTGTKIGTATAQKLGLWNAAPIVQPTTAIAAATFIANTSGIVDDSATWDGYKMGQVVKALRNMGALA